MKASLATRMGKFPTTWPRFSFTPLSCWSAMSKAILERRFSIKSRLLDNPFVRGWKQRADKIQKRYDLSWSVRLRVCLLQRQARDNCSRRVCRTKIVQKPGFEQTFSGLDSFGQSCGLHRQTTLDFDANPTSFTWLRKVNRNWM